jgi:DNA repair protein RadD
MEELKLRPYQADAMNAVLAKWRAGYRSVILVASTGFGKRICLLWLCQLAESRGRNVLVVGNRRLLINQAVKDAAKFDIGYGTIMADCDVGDAYHTTQIASIQTLESRYMYDKYSNVPSAGRMPPADVIAIDEGHQSVDSYRTLMSLYPQAKVLVLTATPVGASGRSLVPDPYDVLTEGALNSRLIRDGYLLPTRVYAPSEPNIEGVKVQNGEEYNQRQLGRAVKECTVFGDVFKEIKDRDKRQTVCFVPGVAFGNDLTAQLNKHFGANSAFMIDAKTKPAERERIFDLIRDGSASYIVSVDVLREGFDLPVLSRAIDLQPNCQFRSYWQKVGRIKRPHGDQKDAELFDFAGNYWRFPHPNEDPQWPTGDETTQEVIDKNRKEGKEKQPLCCPGCGEAYTPKGSPPTCPNCGHQIKGDPVRKIRMGDGRLREVPAYTKAKKLKTEAERKFDQWKGMLWAGMKLGWSLSRCQNVHKYKYGEYPPGEMPFAGEVNNTESKRLLRNITSASGLMDQLNNYQKRFR